MEADGIVGRVRMRELLQYYSRLGLLGFGGPVALVGPMRPAPPVSAGKP